MQSVDTGHRRINDDAKAVAVLARVGMKTGMKTGIKMGTIAGHYIIVVFFGLR